MTSGTTRDPAERWRRGYRLRAARVPREIRDRVRLISEVVARQYRFDRHSLYTLAPAGSLVPAVAVFREVCRRKGVAEVHWRNLCKGRTMSRALRNEPVDELAVSACIGFVELRGAMPEAS